jgi:hypothetical protein
MERTPVKSRILNREILQVKKNRGEWKKNLQDILLDRFGEVCESLTPVMFVPVCFIV